MGSATLKQRVSHHVTEFFFAPATHRPLAVLRIGVGLTLLLQAALIAPEYFDFFGSNGVLQESLAKYFAEPGAPRMGFLVEFLGRLGIAEPVVLGGFGIIYTVSLIALTVGFHTRLAAIFGWFCHWTLMNSSFCSNYGADAFAHIFLFYLAVMPAGGAYSVDLWRKGLSDVPDWQARLSLRVLQLHLCLMYLSSALDKFPGPQWKNGEVIWRSLNLPVYGQYDFTWLAYYPWLAKILTWESLAVEMLYFIFIWPLATRKLWVVLTVALHLGIAVFLGLHVFGLFMAVLTWSIFGWSAEPKRLVEETRGSDWDRAMSPTPIGQQ